MINLNEEIDLLLEYSLATDGNNESLLLLVEKLAPLKARDVKSVFLAVNMPSLWPKLKKKFEEYIVQQEKSPLGSKSNEEVIEKVKRVAQIFDELWNKGTINFDKVIEPEPEPEETPAGGTPEGTPETGEPEGTPETGEPEEDAPEEPRVLSDDERALLAQNINVATAWMAKRLVLMGPDYYNDVGTLRKQGRIIQKYFIQTRRIREEDTPAPTLSSRTTPSARGGTGSDAADMLRLLSKKVTITPEQSKENLKDLEKKVKPDALERKWRDHAGRDEDAMTHFKTTKALIQKYTVEGLSEAVVLKEDKIVEIVIDFNELREKRLDESFLAMFGGWVEHLLKAMFGGYKVPVNIRGSRAEVESFASALGGEKRYIDAAKRYGLDHPTTYKNKAKLETAIKGFEKDTGLVWPYG
jgi:hypothetical protein